jgi:hypothetical protein
MVLPMTYCHYQHTVIVVAHHSLIGQDNFYSGIM